MTYAMGKDGCSNARLCVAAANFAIRWKYGMPMLMAGFDHNRASLDVRSRLSFTEKMTEDIFNLRRALDAVREFVK